MKTETMIRFYAVILSLSLITLTVKYFNLKKDFDVYQKETLGIPGGDIKKAELIDSLQNELFVQQTIVMRHEIALEMLKEENPKAAEAYELILTTKTE